MDNHVPAGKGANGSLGKGANGSPGKGAMDVGRYTRPITLGYVGALVLVALLVTAWVVTLNVVIENNYGRTDLVNQGGRQRMLVTRVALVATRAVQAEDLAERARLARGLADLTVELHQLHDSLFHDPANSFGTTAVGLEARVKDFVAEATALSKAPVAEITVANPHLRRLQDSVDGLVAGLDFAVRQIDIEAREDYKQLRRVTATAYVLVLAVLVLESLLIFIPLVRRTRLTLNELLAKQRELREARDSLDARVRERTVELENELGQHRLTQDRLAASEHRYRSIVEDQTELICRFRPDTEVTYVNAAYSRFVGKPREEMIGHCFAHCIPEEHRASTLAFYAGFTADEPIKEWEHEVVLPDGSLHWLWWRDRAIFDDAGQLTEFQAVGQDITERRRVDGALRTSEERLRQAEQRLLDAIENSSEGFVLWDADDRMVMCNGNYRRFYSPIADVLLPGATFAEVARLAIERGHYIVEGTTGEWSRRLLDFHRTGEGVFEVNFSDGRWVAISDRRTGDGGVVGICTDITASTIALRNLAERELSLTVSLAELDANSRQLSQFAEELEAERDRANAANLAKSQFLANMSHELRTPLNAIMGFSDMFRQETFGPLGATKYAEYADHIHVSGEHLLSLINDILDMSKIEAGKYDLHQEKLNVKELVEDVLTLVAGRAEEEGVRLLKEFPPTLPSLVADYRAIKQVLVNLLTNAVKFTPRGGRVTVSARVVDGCVAVSVADTGVGIAPQYLSQVFEPFVQVDREKKPSQEGTGLGLSLSRSLTRMHGGTLDLESQVGVGTTVTMTLPLWPIQ